MDIETWKIPRKKVFTEAGWRETEDRFFSKYSGNYNGYEMSSDDLGPFVSEDDAWEAAVIALNAMDDDRIVPFAEIREPMFSILRDMWQLKGYERLSPLRYARVNEKSVRIVEIDTLQTVSISFEELKKLMTLLPKETSEDEEWWLRFLEEKPTK